MRRLRTEPAPGDLPADLAAGPLVDVWAANAHPPRHVTSRLARAQWRREIARTAWYAAGTEWGRRNGLRDRGWMALLSDEVRLEVSAIGRAKANSDLRAQFPASSEEWP